MKTWLPLVVLFAVATLGLYRPVLDGPFQFDDQTSIVENETLREANPASWWNYWPTRGLTYLTLGANFQIGGLQPRGYHVVNLIIHFLSSLAVVWFLKLLGLPHLAAAFGGVWFLVHPIQGQSVAYVVQRAASLMTLFTVLAIGLSMVARREGSRAWWVASYGAATLAMVSKEPALVLPLLAVMVHACIESGPLPKRQLAGLALLWVVPATLAFTGRSFGLDAPTLTSQTEDVSHGSYLVTQWEVVARYLQLVVLPIGQNIDHHVPWRSLPGAVPFLLLHLVVGVVGAWCYRRGQRLVTLAIAWFYVALLPESSVFPIEDAMVEHRVTLALLGPALAVAMLLRAVRAQPLVAAILAVVWIGSLSAATLHRAQLWSDPLALWTDALHKSPQKARPQMAVGFYHSVRGNLPAARQHLSRAVELDPDYGMAWNNLGIVGTRSEDFELAARAYGEAARLHPEEAVPWANLAGAQLRQRRFDEAVRAFDRALALDPTPGRLYNDRALALGMLGRWDDAEASIREAEERNAAQDWVAQFIQQRALPDP